MLRGISLVAVVVAMVAASLGVLAPAAAAADPFATGDPWVRRVIYTDEFGVPNPVALATDSQLGILYVGAADATELAGVTIIEDAAPAVDLPQGADPLNVAFDAVGERVLALTPGGLKAKPRQGGPATVVANPNLEEPRGLTIDPATGDLYFLDSRRPRIVRIDPEGVTENINLRGLAQFDLRGIAFNPVDGYLYVAAVGARELFALDDSGRVVASFDMSAAGLSDPGAMAFIPSTDGTDDPSELSLVVVEAGALAADRATDLQAGSQLDGPSSAPIGAEPIINGGLVELSFAEQPQAAATEVAVLENTILTSNLSPPSPDSSGIAYLTHRDDLLLADSEVNEMTIFQNVNLWYLNLDGTQTPDVAVTLPWSNEPTGASYNPATEHLYFVDDTGTRGIYDVDPGTDRVVGGSGSGADDVTQLETTGWGAADPEGVVYDPVSGDVFVADGTDAEIYRFDPGSDNRFNGIGDTLVGQFDVLAMGAEDPEGIAINPFSDTLLIVDRANDIVLETTKSGTLIRTIDIGAANPNKPAGIVLAPASDGLGGWSMYITARGVDNGQDPNENDGRLYEMSLDFGPTGEPPVANGDSAVTDEDVAVDINVAANDMDPDGNLDLSSVSVTVGASNGSAVPGPTPGWVRYTPDADFNGSDSFTYQICDLTLSCDTAVVSVTVDAVADAPVANPDSASTSEGVAVEIDVDGNDTDVDGDLVPSSVTVTVDGVNGSAVPGPTPGSVTYTPDGGFTGSDSFTYQICDATALCDLAVVSVTVGAAGPVFYVSTSTTSTVPGIAGSVRDEDIIAYDTVSASWSMFFDASDVGITTSDLDAFHVRDNGSILISYSSDNITIPGLTGGPNGEQIDDSDVFLFTPTSIGDTTAGSFSFYFDGSDVGLTTNGEDIDGLYEFADGSLGISTTGSITVGALPKSGDEDVHRFTATSFGTNTAGSWVLYFDGSDVGFTNSNADLNAVSFDNNDMIFSTKGAYAAAGGSGANEDISRFTGNFGNTTTGTATLELDLSTLGLDPTVNLDAVHYGGAQ